MLFGSSLFVTSPPQWDIYRVFVLNIWFTIKLRASLSKGKLPKFLNACHGLHPSPTVLSSPSHVPSHSLSFSSTTMLTGSYAMTSILTSSYFTSSFTQQTCNIRPSLGQAWPNLACLLGISAHSHHPDSSTKPLK